MSELLLLIRTCPPLTVRVKIAVLFVVLAEVPITVTVYWPAGVPRPVVIVKVGVQVGLHEVGKKFAVAPVGNPEADRLTCCVVPPVKLRLIAVWPEFPWVTVMFAGLAML